MAREIDPKDTTRAMAFELWMKAPNPMVTFFKTLDITNLVKVSRKKKLKFNMLMDYCIGKAAVSVKEFYLLPVGEALMQYDTIAVNTIVKNKDGEVSSCDILFKDDLKNKYLIHGYMRIDKTRDVRTRHIQKFMANPTSAEPECMQLEKNIAVYGPMHFVSFEDSFVLTDDRPGMGL